MPFGRRQATMMENLLGSFPSMPTMFEDFTNSFGGMGGFGGNEGFGGMRFEDLLGHF